MIKVKRDDIKIGYDITADEHGELFVDENKEIDHEFFEQIYQASSKHISPKSDALRIEIRDVITAILINHGYWFRIRFHADNPEFAFKTPKP